MWVKYVSKLTDIAFCFPAPEIRRLTSRFTLQRVSAIYCLYILQFFRFMHIYTGVSSFLFSLCSCARLSSCYHARVPTDVRSLSCARLHGFVYMQLLVIALFFSLFFFSFSLFHLAFFLFCSFFRVLLILSGFVMWLFLKFLLFFYWLVFRISLDFFFLGREFVFRFLHKYQWSTPNLLSKHF